MTAHHFPTWWVYADVAEVFLGLGGVSDADAVSVLPAQALLTLHEQAEKTKEPCKYSIYIAQSTFLLQRIIGQA